MDTENKGSEPVRIGRREALAGVGVAATTAALGLGMPNLVRGERPRTGEGAGEHVQPHPRDLEPPDPNAAHGLTAASADVRALFGTLREGSRLADRWTIESIHGVRAGAIPVIMRSADVPRFALEIFRADARGPSPVASAGSLALFLVNRGDGASSTPEDAGLGVMALARALQARLAQGAAVPASLATHAERQARHPMGIFHIPV